MKKNFEGLSSSLTMDIIPRTEPPNIRTSASHDFNETKNRLSQNPDHEHDSEDQATQVYENEDVYEGRFLDKEA